MAIRLEKSGGLYFIKGSPDEPATAKQERKIWRELGLWLALIALVTGALFFGPHAPGWPAVNHISKALLAAIW